MNDQPHDPTANRDVVIQATDSAIAASLAITPSVPGAPTEFAHVAAAPLAETAKRALPAFKPTLESMMTTAEDLMAFNQANIDALMKSGQIWAAGVQDLGKHMATSAQAQLDQTMSTWKAMAGVKSVKEAVDMQAGLARSAIEAAVNGTGKLTDASLKLSEEAFAPITARLSVAVEKFGSAA